MTVPSGDAIVLAPVPIVMPIFTRASACASLMPSPAMATRVLWIVLVINATMFLVEGVAGWVAQSTSLLADSLDMLGDALVYGFSLFVLSRSSTNVVRRGMRGFAAARVPRSDALPG